jgi:excisionase family DNA binding protein
MPSSINGPIVLPDSENAQMVELRRLVQRGSAKLVGLDGQQLELPATVHELLLSILKNLEAGKAISIVPENQQLTTQRAAILLGVSRPFLVGLLETGEIPFHMVGSHRRIYLKDLLSYKHRRDNARHGAIDRMGKTQMEDGVYDEVILPEGAEDE